MSTKNLILVKNKDILDIMRKRPTLKESIAILEQYKMYNSYCSQALIEYKELKKTNEFLASRIIVEIVNNFYKKSESISING